MVDGENVVQAMWRLSETMSYGGAGNVCSVQKRGGLMSAGYAILECFGDPMCVP